MPLTWPRRPTTSAPAAARDRPWTPARLLELVTVKGWDGWMDAPSWLTASHEVIIIAVGASCGPGACLNSFFLRSCVLPTPGLPRPNSVRSADPSHRYLFIMSLSVPRNGCCPSDAAAAAISFVAPAMRLRLAGCLASWRSSVPLFGAGEVEACSTACRPPPCPGDARSPRNLLSALAIGCVAGWSSLPAKIARSLTQTSLVIRRKENSGKNDGEPFSAGARTHQHHHRHRHP